MLGAKKVDCCNGQVQDWELYGLTRLASLARFGGSRPTFTSLHIHRSKFTDAEDCFSFVCPYTRTHTNKKDRADQGVALHNMTILLLFQLARSSIHRSTAT